MLWQCSSNPDSTSCWDSAVLLAVVSGHRGHLFRGGHNVWPSFIGASDVASWLYLQQESTNHTGADEAC
jgi:hypothetical protein